VTQSSSKEGTNPASARKPVGPPMQTIIKGGWTYRVETDIERSASALRDLAQYVKNTSAISASVANGPKLRDPEDKAYRKNQIESLATELEKLADAVPLGSVTYNDVEAVLSKLQKFDAQPDNLLVSNVARAFVWAGLDKPGDTMSEERSS
jgi:hypothetical protein